MFRDAPRPYDGLYDPSKIETVVEDDHSRSPEEIADQARKTLSKLPHSEGWREPNSQYYGILTQIDECIGDIRAALEARGELDNTIFVYASDHGEMNFNHGLIGKYNMYDASARVPLLVRFPPKIKAGTAVGAPVSLNDLGPTCFDLVGFPSPRCPDRLATAIGKMQGGCR